MDPVVAFFKGFLAAIGLTIMLCISVVGIIPIMVTKIFVVTLLGAVLSPFGGTAPTDAHAYLIIFLLTWAGFSYGFAKGYITDQTFNIS